LLRIGFGEDAHRLVTGRRLLIGGVPVESVRGSEAHSDGDVLLHALSDALLSAFALGDIGQLYPPGIAATADLDSSVILEAVLGLVLGEGAWQLVNVAAVVTLDAPKLGPYRERIQERLAHLLRLPAGAVGVTFKTSEGLAPDHVQARVTVLLQRRA
jgi:2-C-methyl-D-erythritol 2,4-cyclodiphosphate synthase